ncbi:substrate-binding domain-containing protein [Pseudomonas aeruginosa]|nr:substrate-binding domain-containing protein [Pseudomonas aeruginosa]
MCNTDRDDEQERHHLAALQSYNVEGLIVNTLGHHPGELRALHRELPMVLRWTASWPSWIPTWSAWTTPTPSNRPLDHLQHRGFRDILLVTEPLDGTSSRIERVQAFNASIGRRPALKGQVLQTDDFFRDGLRAFLSASGPGPKALFTCNGVATLCATRQLRDLGCRLFDEVGLLALDELDWYPLVGSGITALAQPTDEIGRTAFERLLARLEGDREPARRVTFPAQLIVRGSTHPRG